MLLLVLRVSALETVFLTNAVDFNWNRSSMDVLLRLKAVGLLGDKSMDILVVMFSPLQSEEFMRLMLEMLVGR